MYGEGLERNRIPLLHNNSFNKPYWHIQMHMPYGKNDIDINPIPLLKEKEPVIGTGEWDSHQCINFKNIEKGSIVLVRKGNEAIALCEIVGDCFMDETLQKKYHHVNYRKIRILAWAENYVQPRSQLFSQGTFFKCNSHTEQYRYINNWIKNIYYMEFVNKCTNLLKDKHNIILQGAPGTGKTYKTAEIALSVLGIRGVNPTDHGDVMEQYRAMQGKRIFFTTFHQSLDYEDFVEGLKPRIQEDGKGNGIGVTYNPEDGIFKLACNAAEEGNEPVVLIIDEINRGNVSRIFGELITLLESDKRSGGEHPIKVILPYSKKPFGVPSNLYIIGTMNTTDRSTGTIDYALRRRFAFITLAASEEVVRNHYAKTGNKDLEQKAVKLFKDIKSFMESPKHLCGDLDIDDLMIGHSYFMARSEEELRNKMEYEVIPLIDEYINDGILSVRQEEKKKAFHAWKGLETMKAEEDNG